jgi:hypothetical protein
MDDEKRRDRACLPFLCLLAWRLDNNTARLNRDGLRVAARIAELRDEPMAFRFGPHAGSARVEVPSVLASLCASPISSHVGVAVGTR